MHLVPIIKYHYRCYGATPNTCMKLLTRKQKTPTAGTSAKRIRLPSVRQQMQKTPTAGTSTEMIRLPSVRQQMEKTSPTAGASTERIRLPGVRQ